jgi:RHS repeat-associated protein
VYLDGEGIDEHLGHVTRTKAVTYETDHLGTVLNGEAIGQTRIHGTFGERMGTNHTLSNSSDPAQYGFAGRSLDWESELYYNRARVYSASLGRFMTKDPIGFNAGDVNLYRYVNNNPVNFTDPSGLDAFSELIEKETLINSTLEAEGSQVVGALATAYIAVPTVFVGVPVVAMSTATTSPILLNACLMNPERCFEIGSAVASGTIQQLGGYSGNHDIPPEMGQSPLAAIVERGTMEFVRTIQNACHK